MASLPLLFLLQLCSRIAAQAEPTVDVAALQASMDILHSALFGPKDQAPRIGVLADTLNNVLILREQIPANHDSLVARLDGVDSVIIGFNKTLSDIQDDIHTVKQRQAAAAVLSVCQLLIFLVYLGTIIINYLMKWCKVQQERQQFFSHTLLKVI